MSSEKVTKVDLIETVYRKCDTVEKKVVQGVIDTVFDEIKHSMKRGATLELRGFGTFEPRLRKGRDKARNPKTGAPLKVKPHYVAAFRSGRDLRTAMWELPVS
jgi:integration host factor subunit beta